MFVEIMRKKVLHFRYNYPHLAKRQRVRRTRYPSSVSGGYDDVSTDEEEDAKPFRTTDTAAKLGGNDASSYVLVFQLSSERLQMISDNAYTQEVRYKKYFSYCA